MINSSRPPALIMTGVLQDPLGLPPPAKPPRPPGRRSPPGPPGPPGPPKFGRGRTAVRPSRSLSSVSAPPLSESHSANHFSKVPFSSARVSDPSLSVSAAVKRPGPMNLPGPNPRPPPARGPLPGGAPRGPNPCGGGSTSLSRSANWSWLNLPALSASSLSNHAAARSTGSAKLAFGLVQFRRFNFPNRLAGFPVERDQARLLVRTEIEDAQVAVQDGRDRVAEHMIQLAEVAMPGLLSVEVVSINTR